MEITEFAARITLHKPIEFDLPKVDGDYYVIDEDGKHSIMTYSFHGFNNSTNWDGGSGYHSMKHNCQIYIWTELLPITLPDNL